MKTTEVEGYKLIEIGPIEIMKTTRDHAAAMLVMCDEADIKTDIYSIGAFGRHFLFVRLKHD